MKKFIKSIIILGLFLIPCFSNAWLELKYTHTAIAWNDLSYTCTQWNFICAKIGYCPSFAFNFDHWSQANSMWSWASDPVPNQLWVCSNNTTIYYTTSSTCALYIDCYSLTDYTSLQCQTEYNLIPVSEVTSNYCKLNFDLISPSECPSGGGCSWSGDLVFSNVYIDNVLYPGGADIYLNINERLATEISYNSDLMYIDIDFDGDEDYINGIISINEYRPTSDDFTSVFVSGLTLIFPYIVITLFVLFIRKLIRKIFK